MSVSKLYLTSDSNRGVFLWTLWIIQEDLQMTGSKTPVQGLFLIKLQAWRSEPI